MMKSTEYELLREREQGKPKDLVVCGTCHRCYDRAYMWHHRRHCHSSEDTVSPPSIPVSLMRTSAAVSDHFKVDILDHFVNDDVGRLCKTDPTILLVGQSLYAMVKQKPDKKSGVKSSVKANMRMLGNLYTEFQQHNPASQGDPATSVDMLERRNFPALEHAIEQYTRSGGELKAGLKGALYYLLKKMAAAVKANFIINHQDAKASEIEKFVVVLEMHHTSLFGDATYQVNVNRQTKLRRPQSLPSDNTVAKVREFTVATIKCIIANHREKVLPSPAFTLLRDLALCRLTLFNFRRGGEPARLALSDWSDARHDMWIDQARVKKMAPVEQEMFANLKVMYQTGKGNDHLVPVLVPTDVAPALCLLAQPDNRKAVGVSKDNPFLFPVVHAGSDHCSGYHSVRRVVNLAGVEDGSTLTPTKMRHYSSTHYAALDVPQNQRTYFYLHMGHSQQINEQIYQTPLAEAEVTVVGKFLQQLDQGTLKQGYAVE